MVRPFYRDFYRVEAGRGFEEAGEGLRGFGLHAWEHVLVGGHREPGGGVAEAFGDDLDGHAGFEEEGGVGVAEVVESYAGES